MRFKLTGWFKLILPVVVAAMVFAFWGGVAWAQDGLLGGLAGAVFGAVGTTEFITGGVLPFLIMLVVQSNWTWKAKANVAWMLCFVAAVIVAAFQGQLAMDFTSIPVVLGKFTAITVSAKNIYDGVYKPIGIADAVTKATDVLKPNAIPSSTSSIPPAPSNVLDETPGTSSDFNVPAASPATGSFNIPASYTPVIPVASDKVDLADDTVNKLVRGIGGVLVDALAKKI